MATDNKKGKRNAVQCNCSPPADQHQNPFLNPDWTHFWVTSPCLCIGNEFYSVEYLFGHFWSPVPARIPPASFCIPLCLRIVRAWGKRKKKIANPKTSVYYQYYLHSKSKWQYCNSYWENINSILAETRTCDWEFFLKIPEVGTIMT